MPKQQDRLQALCYEDLLEEEVCTSWRQLLCLLGSTLSPAGIIMAAAALPQLVVQLQLPTCLPACLLLLPDCPSSPAGGQPGGVLLGGSG
jgi:hypothetical protein